MQTSFHSLKGGWGCEKFYPVLRGGGRGRKASDLRYSHFVAPPLPVINDQSLSLVSIVYQSMLEIVDSSAVGECTPG